MFGHLWVTLHDLRPAKRQENDFVPFWCGRPCDNGWVGHGPDLGELIGPVEGEMTERRRNRTFQPLGCNGLPVLKCVALLAGEESSVCLTGSQFAEVISELPSSGHVSGHGSSATSRPHAPERVAVVRTTVALL